MPLAFLGGYINLPTYIFNVILGLVLICSAVHFLIVAQREKKVSEPPRFQAVSVGAGIGLLSGLTGTGGGIFLTPLLLFMGWAKTKSAAAVSALFILVNSVAGLVGYLASAWANANTQLNVNIWLLLIAPLFLAAAVGGGVGSYLGSRRFESAVIKRFLALVLFIAGAKLIFTAKFIFT